MAARKEVHQRAVRKEKKKGGEYNVKCIFRNRFPKCSNYTEVDC